jgi:hypothetical protein
MKWYKFLTIAGGSTILSAATAILFYQSILGGCIWVVLATTIISAATWAVKEA